jgi:hypothetical protein
MQSRVALLQIVKKEIDGSKAVSGALAFARKTSAAKPASDTFTL